MYLTIAFFKIVVPNIFLSWRFQFQKLSIFQFPLLIDSTALSFSLFCNMASSPHSSLITFWIPFFVEDDDETDHL